MWVLQRGASGVKTFSGPRTKRVKIYGWVGWNRFELRSYSPGPSVSKAAGPKLREQSDVWWQPAGTVLQLGPTQRLKLHRVPLPWPGSGEVQELAREGSLLGLGYLCGPHCGELGS